jgi:site-specific recombinase XerC
MRTLRQRMQEDLQLRNRSAITQQCYLRGVRQFVEYFGGRPPAKLGEREIREFLLHLVKERGVSPATHHQHVAALRFFYKVTLHRPAAVARIPFPKVPRALPEILSGSEVERLLGCITSVKYRSVCSVAYGAGLRIHEATTLRIADIDSIRGLISAGGSLCRLPHRRARRPSRRVRGLWLRAAFLQLLLQQALPQVPGHRRCPLGGGPQAGDPARPPLPRRLHPAR